MAEQRKGQARGPAPGQQEPQGLTHIPRPAPTKGRPDASMSKALTAKLQNNPHGDQSVPGEERLQPRGRSRSGAWRHEELALVPPFLSIRSQHCPQPNRPRQRSLCVYGFLLGGGGDARTTVRLGDQTRRHDFVISDDPVSPMLLSQDSRPLNLSASVTERKRWPHGTRGVPWGKSEPFEEFLSRELTSLPRVDKGGNRGKCAGRHGACVRKLVM